MKTLTRRFVTSLMLMAAAPGLIPAAYAATLIDNLSGLINADIGLGQQGRSAAVGFTMPAVSFPLESLTLRIDAFVDDPPFVVRLFDNNALNNPGVPLLSFLNPAISGLASGQIQDVVFTPAAPFTLVAGVTYWIVVHVEEDPPLSYPGWTSGNPSTIPTGDATFFGVKFNTFVQPNPPTTDFPCCIGAFAVTTGEETGEPSTMDATYEYAAKVVCGVQKDAEVMRLAQERYATSINIHNPGPDTVKFRKKVALTYPPANQAPGEVTGFKDDELKPDLALKVDCEDIRDNFVSSIFPATTSYIEGFLVIRSPKSLDVVGVYTTGPLGWWSSLFSRSSIDVEHIPERVIEP